jgi:hypothetical protein
MSIDAGSRWLDANWKELRKFENQWIAAGSEGVIANGKSYQDLSDKIEKSRIDLSKIIFAFITFDVVE